MKSWLNDCWETLWAMAIAAAWMVAIYYLLVLASLLSSGCQPQVHFDSLIQVKSCPQPTEVP